MYNRDQHRPPPPQQYGGPSAAQERPQYDPNRLPYGGVSGYTPTPQAPPYASSSAPPPPSPSSSYYPGQQQQQQQQQQQYARHDPSPSPFDPNRGQPRAPSSSSSYDYNQRISPSPSSSFSSSHGHIQNRSSGSYDPNPHQPLSYHDQYSQHTPSYGQSQPHLNLDPQNVAASEARIWFDSVDVNRSGAIDSAELKNALSRSSPDRQFSDECAQMMVRMFDRSGSGRIDFREFEQLHHYLQSMQQAFDMEDVDRSGRLEYNETCGALRRGGHVLSPQTIQTVFQRFDRNRVGSLGLDGYIELCIFLGNARNVFERFDTNRSGTVMFNMDSFVSASTNFM